jgi:hypothetical protein
MPSLKEIAPMVLAGLASAASPQAGQAFQNIHQMGRQRKLDEQRDEERKTRLKWAAEAAGRGERREEREVERHGQIVKLGALRQAEADRAVAERKEKREKLERYRGVVTDEYAEDIAARPGGDIAIAAAESIKEIDTMLEEYGLPTPAELLEKTKSITEQYAEQGMGVQVNSRGEVVNSWPLSQGEPEYRAVEEDVNDVLADAQATQQEFDTRQERIGIKLNRLNGKLNNPALTIEEKEEIQDQIEELEDESANSEADERRQMTKFENQISRITEGRSNVWEEAFPPAPTAANPVDWAGYTDEATGVRVGDLRKEIQSGAAKTPTPDE